MAKTLKRIIESVKEELSQYKLTDDFPIEDEYFIDKANDMRASLLREEYKTGKIDDKFYQSMCCLQVECANVGCEINGIMIPSDTVVWYIDMPKLVDGVGWFEIKYLGLMGFLAKFIRKSFDGWMDLEGNIHTGFKPAYTVIGSRVYLKNLPSGINFLCLVGLLYNPTDICDYNEDVDEYPVPSDSTLQLLMKKDILATYTPIPDARQDSKHPDVTDFNSGKKE